MMRLHSYVVARDFGFAPNPFFGICTLATCKPRIRSVAQIGDWVVGTGSKKNQREKRVVFAMRVTAAMSFEEYWKDPRFQTKKPNLRAVRSRHLVTTFIPVLRTPVYGFRQTRIIVFSDGSPNQSNISTDTSTNRVLLSDDFVYWGGSGPELPRKLLSYGSDQISICAGRNHKNDFPARLVQDFVDWVRSFNDAGYAGEPLDWRRTA